MLSQLAAGIMAVGAMGKNHPGCPGQLVGAEVAATAATRETITQTPAAEPHAWSLSDHDAIMRDSGHTVIGALPLPSHLPSHVADLRSCCPATSLQNVRTPNRQRCHEVIAAQTDIMGRPGAHDEWGLAVARGRLE